MWSFLFCWISSLFQSLLPDHWNLVKSGTWGIGWVWVQKSWLLLFWMSNAKAGFGKTVESVKVVSKESRSSSLPKNLHFPSMAFLKSHRNLWEKNHIIERKPILLINYDTLWFVLMIYCLWKHNISYIQILTEIHIGKIILMIDSDSAGF